MELSHAHRRLGFRPALAAGNTVVLKPAELTPLTAMRLAELADQAGLPEGVFTVLPGRGEVVGERFVSHPAVRKICFTGSTEVGTRIMAGCARQVKRLTLELGGKSANIVFADADLGRAAAGAPYAVFDNAGQDCCARSRLLVQRSVYDRFLELLEPAVRAFRVGDPADESTEMGPLISAGQRDRVAGYVDGSRVAFTGSRPDGSGYWYPRQCCSPTHPGTVTGGRRSSVRSSRCSRSTTRMTPSGWRTTPSTVSPARSGPATWAGRCGWPGPWKPAT
ncbi:hypothetical protein GCM10029963_29870 [Micromonospora andamanensis]